MPEGKAKRSSSYDNRQRGQSLDESQRQGQGQGQAQGPKLSTEEMLNAVGPLLTEQQIASFKASTDQQKKMLAEEWYESLQEKQIGEQIASQNLSRSGISPQNSEPKTKNQNNLMQGMNNSDQQSHANIILIYEQIKQKFPALAEKIAAKLEEENHVPYQDKEKWIKNVY
jgi:hypothetical protein